MTEPRRRSVRTELEIRAMLEPEGLSKAFRILREAGGRLRAHLVYRLQGADVGLFLCEKPEAAALALAAAGVEIETETVVVVETESAPGAMLHLIEVLEAEGIRIGYSYAASNVERLLVVLRADDNPKAEDVLTDYLIPEDPRRTEDL